jgi:hypothetical protein
MQQRYQPTPINLMHIALDLKCNKAFIKQKSSCMSGACLRYREVSFPSESSNRHQHLWWRDLLRDWINTHLLISYTIRNKICMLNMMEWMPWCVMHDDEQSIAYKRHLERINISYLLEYNFPSRYSYKPTRLI